MTFSKSELLSYLENPFVFKLVQKVILFNFNCQRKTADFMNLLQDFLCSKEVSPTSINTFLTKYSLGLSQEQNRVNQKISDLLSIIHKHIDIQPSSLLDIGVGNGNIITALGNKMNISSCQLYGVDVVDYSKNKNFVHVNYIENYIPLNDNTIDCAFIMMVLHHTKNPEDTLKEAYRIIKPNGSIIIRETNAYNEDLVQFNILMEYIFYYILLKIPAQITRNYYSDTQWEALFNKAGFTFKKVSESSLEENVFTGMYYVLTKD